MMDKLKAETNCCVERMFFDNSMLTPVLGSQNSDGTLASEGPRKWAVERTPIWNAPFLWCAVRLRGGMG